MPYIEILLQTLLAFFALLIFARLLGKQQVGQLTFFEYVNGITIGSIAGTLATSLDIRTSHNFVSLLFFVSLTLIAQYVSVVSRPLRKLLDGEPTVIIHNGKILEQNMKKMRYNLDELLQQLRTKDAFDISRVEFALLEPDGKLSVQLKSQYQPVTPNDLNLTTGYQGIGSELIIDGEIVKENLVQNYLTEEWLRQELAARGIVELEEVVLAYMATDGKLYFDLKRDQIETPTDISDTFSQGTEKN
ncbi:MAG: DUF421 domain-containing protein [Bacillota bacterium]|nr:DUF421 domain-containing protein [Bacillota bacterium]